ncbi:hypothetical protein EXN66_Car006487 [Channa argus]|uniref:Uncharacterized protein n=1 Tax=Channa argus TaxID=215402 RepID=A0A6G1PKU9_CHAAH|nr:hypothetical protein EXN66_Car006487 [Channa argus]
MWNSVSLEKDKCAQFSLTGLLRVQRHLFKNVVGIMSAFSPVCHNGFSIC